MTFRLLNSGYSLPAKAIEELFHWIGAPSIMHQYGANEPEEIGSQMVWMEYDNPQLKGSGSIGFSRNTALYAPTLVDSTIKFLSHVLPPKLLHYNQVHLLRTIGSVIPHVDEARNCCINIGLINSTKASTFVNPKGTTREEFELKKERYVCGTGFAYLLDVKSMHEVVAKPGHEYVQRFLITHSFRESFEEIEQAHIEWSTS
jgi:hypothetical protein